MKKLLITTLLLINLPAFAYENYMIISEMPVKSVEVQTPEIVQAKPLYTIDNEKKIIIVTPQNTGKTKINVNLYVNKAVLDIDISENTTKIKPQKGFNYFHLDEPPQEIDIPLPPTLQGGKSWN